MNEVSAASLVGFSSNEQIQNLVGPENENLDTLEKLTGTSITHNGNQFSITASTAQKMKTHIHRELEFLKEGPKRR